VRRRALRPSWGLVALLAFACNRLEHGVLAHTCAVLQDGSAWCWGLNDRGQLGDGTAYDRARPVAVAGLPPARSVAAGWGFTCAATASGEAWCWGANDEGQLGDGGAEQERWTPGPIPGLANVTRVVAGDGACAIAGGEVWCWGQQFANAPARRVPEKVTGRPVPVVDAVSADFANGWCALLDDATVRCWGEDHVATDAGLSSVAAIASGGVGVCAVLQDGSVTCGTFPRRAVGVAFVRFRPCALLDDGTVWCSADFPNPVAAGAVAITGGDRHACARLASGQLSCWGENGAGQLGDGTDRDRDGAVLVAGLPDAATDVSASPAAGPYPGCGP
jgi:hypothetical protein